MQGKSKAVFKGISEAVIQAIELVPGLASLIESVRAYQECIDDQQREIFIRELEKRVSHQEATFKDPWYQTVEGQEIVKKLAASALNAEYADKVEYFAKALLNASMDIGQDKKLKFIEILRQISKPALKVLAAEKQLHEERGRSWSSQVELGPLVTKTSLEAHLVEACIKELYSLGVFSSATSFNKEGDKSTGFETGTPAFVGFTDEFIRFISEPDIDDLI